jgi:predicted Zn-dependent peptidase
MLWTKKDLPLVATTVLFTPGGPLASPARAGLPTLAAAMLDEGAGELDATAFASALQLLGANFSASAGPESASANLLVLKRNYGKAAGLLADAIRRPRMQESDWERVKRLHLENLRQEDEEPTIVASRVGVRELFGKDNPFGWPTQGTVATVEPLKLDDVKAEHARLLRPEFATILVAGDITPEEAKAALEKAFDGWSRERSGAKPDQSGRLEAKAGSGLRVYLVDRPEAVQTVIRFITPGPRYQNEQRPQLRLLNTILGGSFTSRLNQNLREQHGYTYGARSSFQMLPSAGYFVAAASVKADVTGEALKEFMLEFNRLRQGTVSAEEATKARETIKADTVQDFAGLGGLLGAAVTPLTAGAPFATIGQDLKAMEGVSAADLNALAEKAIPIEGGVLVLVGDQKVIMDQIKNLGLPEPTLVDAQGEPVKAGG